MTEPIDLLPLLRSRLGEVSSPRLAERRVTITLTSAGRTTWTVDLDHGFAVARYGRPPRPDLTVHAPISVLADVISGRRSAASAFLAGSLTVRGDLSLALELDGLFPPPTASRSRWSRRPRSEQRDAATPRIRTGTVDAVGVPTFYIEAGPPHAPPLVLLHGLAATNASMLPLLEAFAPTHRVLAPDFPGHGGTPAASGSYAPERLAEWLETFLAATRATSERSAVLIGNSLGGRVAIEIALEHPEAVSGIVLLSPAVAFRRVRHFEPFVRLVRDEVATIKLPMPRPMVIRGLRSLFADSDALPEAWYDAAADEFLRVWGTRGSRYAMFSALRHIYLDQPFGESGFWDRLGGLTPPALFIWGKQDVLVTSNSSRYVTELLPNARSVVLDNCGHIPQFEQRERTNELIAEFLAGLTANRAPAQRR